MTVDQGCIAVVDALKSAIPSVAAYLPNEPCIGPFGKIF
jgi:hypothetical protein